jgi:hypothetical protein
LPEKIGSKETLTEILENAGKLLMIEDYEGVLTTSRKAGSQEAPEDQGTSVK